MSEPASPTICVKCKHHEPPVPHIFGGRHYCDVVVEEPDFVTGEGRRTKPPCELKNLRGNCPDFEAKKA